MMKLLLLHCHLVLVLVSCQITLQLLPSLHLSSAGSMSLPLFFRLNIHEVFYFSSLKFVLLLCT